MALEPAFLLRLRDHQEIKVIHALSLEHVHLEQSCLANLAHCLLKTRKPLSFNEQEPELSRVTYQRGVVKDDEKAPPTHGAITVPKLTLKIPLIWQLQSAGTAQPKARSSGSGGSRKS